MSVISFAEVLCGIGSEPFKILGTDTLTAKRATYLILTGLGLGLGVNVSQIAIQAVVKT